MYIGFDMNENAIYIYREKKTCCFIGLGDCPAGLEPPPGARNRRKSTVKYEETPLERRCHEYTQNPYYSIKDFYFYT